jgi:predicted transcriptional regulator
MRNPTIRDRIFKLIAKFESEGLICEEIERILGLRHQTVSARLTELYEKDKIKIAGRKRTTSGKTARIYVAS